MIIMAFAKMNVQLQKVYDIPTLISCDARPFYPEATELTPSLKIRTVPAFNYVH